MFGFSRTDCYCENKCVQEDHKHDLFLSQNCQKMLLLLKFPCFMKLWNQHSLFSFTDSAALFCFSTYVALNKAAPHWILLQIEGLHEACLIRPSQLSTDFHLKSFHLTDVRKKVETSSFWVLFVFYFFSAVSNEGLINCRQVQLKDQQQRKNWSSHGERKIQTAKTIFFN